MRQSVNIEPRNRIVWQCCRDVIGIEQSLQEPQVREFRRDMFCATSTYQTHLTTKPKNSICPGPHQTPSSFSVYSAQHLVLAWGGTSADASQPPATGFLVSQPLFQLSLAPNPMTDGVACNSEGLWSSDTEAQNRYATRRRAPRIALLGRSRCRSRHSDVGLGRRSKT